MRLFLKNLDQNVCPIDIEPSDTFLILRRKIEEQVGIDRSAQRLFCLEKRLDGDKIQMSAYNIQEGATINIIHHGPLERLPK